MCIPQNVELLLYKVAVKHLWLASSQRQEAVISLDSCQSFNKVS